MGGTKTHIPYSTIKIFTSFYYYLFLAKKPRILFNLNKSNILPTAIQDYSKKKMLITTNRRSMNSYKFSSTMDYKIKLSPYPIKITNNKKILIVYNIANY